MKAIALVHKGHAIERLLVTWEGRTLAHEKSRRSWSVQTSPKHFARGWARRPVFNVSDKTSTTFDAPENVSVVPFDKEDGKGEQMYAVTPELLNELRDGADLKAFNLAVGLPKTIILLAMGAGAAIMVFAAMLFWGLTGSGFI